MIVLILAPIFERRARIVGSLRAPCRSLLDSQRAVHPRRAVAGGLAEEGVGAGLELDGDRGAALGHERARAERRALGGRAACAGFDGDVVGRRRTCSPSRS